MKILIIQTAFLGDTILATSALEKLHKTFPDAELDFMLRKGNEMIFATHPFLRKLYVWDKKNKKTKNLFRILKEIRAEKYDYVFNLQRFFSTGWLTFLSQARQKIGFSNNPFAFCYSLKAPYNINDKKHDTERTDVLISKIAGNELVRPKIYISDEDFSSTKKYKSEKYVCIFPSSVWFTKQFPAEKWIELMKELCKKYTIYLLGSPADYDLCKTISEKVNSEKVEILVRDLKFGQTLALMNDAEMTYSNDSAPIHMASALNSKITSVFCSTIPEFGFYPLSDVSKIVQTKDNLLCRPCGNHGKRECPKSHFNCAYRIPIDEMLF